MNALNTHRSVFVAMMVGLALGLTVPVQAVNQFGVEWANEIQFLAGTPPEKPTIGLEIASSGGRP